MTINGQSMSSLSGVSGNGVHDQCNGDNQCNNIGDITSNSHDDVENESAGDNMVMNMGDNGMSMEENDEGLNLGHGQITNNGGQIINNGESIQSHNKCKPNEENIMAKDKCFCGVEAAKIHACLKKNYPTWPLLKQQGHKDCGSPIKNPGFGACVASNAPKGDPQAGEKVEECIVKTGAVAK